MKKPLIVLTGPTAVGKTKLSIALAKAVNGEIILILSFSSRWQKKPWKKFMIKAGSRSW